MLWSDRTAATLIKREFSYLPKSIQIADVLRTLSDDRTGFQWSILFAESMGNVPALACGLAIGFPSGTTCSQQTLIEGNYIGGYFAVGSSRLMASDISASDMETELELLDGMMDVSVTRTGPSFQGGYVWTVTWLTAIGNRPDLSFSNSLTGSGTTITGSTIQQGNYLGGSYNVLYKGKKSFPIAFDASPVALATSLSQLVSANVVVSRGSITTEGGSIYAITFTGIDGDVDLLQVDSAALVGVGASVRVAQTVQGSLTSGSKLKVSFDSPLYCSSTQVKSLESGSNLDSYSLEVGNSRGEYSRTIPIPVDYSVQIVRVAAPSLLDPNYFDGEDATGYFQLTYNGVTTSPINSHASALDVRDALEALPGINTVWVTRSYSFDSMPGTVSAIRGSLFLTCSSLPLVDCRFNTLPPGELIRISGLWYKVAASYTYSSATLPLSFANDSSIITAYDGPTVSAAPYYRWARGFEWTVTLISISTNKAFVGGSQGFVGGSVLPLSSPKHGINPPDASVSVRPSDCVECAYINDLVVWKPYLIRIRAHNALGFGPYTITPPVTPKEIPSPPQSVRANSVSGTEIEVFFSPPAGVISDIST